jgi:catechol 2,3-dioxygenase-like lactoylglutathione lyase family enzyme
MGPNPTFVTARCVTAARCSSASPEPRLARATHRRGDRDREDIEMTVKRIVANLAVSEPAQAKKFYEDVLGLDVLMDMGWIATYGSKQTMTVQISVMTEGGSGTPVPDLSIEVDDLDAVLARVKKAKIPVEYGPANEPWGVRRFFVRDPFGKLVNILVHEA